MSEPLYELLEPYFEDDRTGGARPKLQDPVTARYLKRVSTLQLSSLDTTEPQSLAQSAHTNLLSIQALSTRSSKAIISSAEHLKSVQETLPLIASDARDLRDGVSTLDKSAVGFSEKYSRAGENEALDRRKQALLMNRNIDRLTDMLELPTLLASAISAATAQGISGNANYASALDLHSHIKRLHILYPDSAFLRSIYGQAEDAMREMTSNLIASLKVQNIKLAAGMRTIGWLRRIAPELDGGPSRTGSGTTEGSLGGLFLVCRLSNLLTMLDALEPLRDLADQESERRKANAAGAASTGSGGGWSGGQQTERYLKRYIEIFREQSFAIVSMFKSIFPAEEATGGAEDLSVQFKSIGLQSTTITPERQARVSDKENPLQPPPSALVTFPLYLVEILTETLRTYLPNVRDKSSRESLLTQVLYCAGSLGRLGGDFGMILAALDEEEEEEEEEKEEEDDEEGGKDADESSKAREWIAAIKKHRVLAGRLESLASGGSRKMSEVELHSKGIKV